MSTPEPSANQPQAPEKKVPVWKNPFVIAFAIGVVFLTVAPFIQRQFLKAPPPVHSLAPWVAPTLDGQTLNSQALKGTVWLANFAPEPCAADCRARQELLGRAVNHVDDLDGKIILVTIAMPGAAPALKDLATKSKLWRIVTGTREEVAPILDGFRAGFAKWAPATDAGSDAEEFAHLGAIVVVDQNGDIRGFWQDDAAGRGNSVNAARLLAKHGANP